MKKYLENDEDVEILETWKDLKEYLTFRAKHDEWVQPFINELAAIGIPNHPLFFQTNCTNLSVQKNGYRLDVKDIDYEDPENLSCIEDTGLFLVFPYKDSMAVYPTRRIAYPSICKRGDDDSMVMARFDPKANKQVLPINEKADRLTRDFQLFSDNCKILLRDGKVSAVLSKEYVILPADKMISILENQLKQDHPDFTFNRGQVSHEYLMVEYLMNDEEMEQSFRLKLNDAGADISELKAGIRFSTSDIGASKVYASVFYDADGVRTTCNSGIALEHKNGMINRKKECDELIEACPDDYKLIKSALIGTCYYAAVRMLKKTEQPVVGIVIKTTVRMKEDLNFLYKWVSEDMGPADTYCPDNILDELSETDSDWAKNWRAECRKCNERKQKLSAMPVGAEIKVTCEGFEYVMTKTVLPSHSTPQWINFEENFKFTVDDIVRSGFSCIDLEKSEENKMEHITKIWKYIFTFDKKGEITFESTGALECKECLKTIKLKDQISWESTLRKDKIGTVICNMPTEKDAFAHFTYYYVYLTEDNPRYAISLIQKKMEDRVDFLQKETSRLNLNIQTLNKKIILLNEEKLEEHDKN